MSVDNARGNQKHDGISVFDVSPGFVSVLLGTHIGPYIATTRISGCKLLSFHSSDWTLTFKYFKIFWISTWEILTVWAYLIFIYHRLTMQKDVWSVHLLPTWENWWVNFDWLFWKGKGEKYLKLLNIFVNHLHTRCIK